jgi:Ca2+-binding RTX toxin-like protein
MSSVTVPGTGGSIITITTNGTATHLIAQQIANALAAAGSRAVTTTGSGGPLPPTTPGATNELVITGGGSTNNVTGFPFVTNNNTSPNTISGLNTAILSGTVGGSFWVDGNSTVAAGGGNNLIIGGPGGNYQLAAGDGNDTIYTSGGGTIAGGGANFLWAADPTDPLPNYIISDGIGDTVAAGVGPDTVVAYGSNDLIFGGTGTLVVGAAPNSTVVSGTGAETIFGASGSLVQGDGSAGILFVGGAGSATVFGSTASVTTIFGGPGSAITFQNNGAPGAIMSAYAGNETLSSALSTSNNSLAGGSGNASLLGGAGNDVFWSGTGSNTLTGGAGSDNFAFIKGASGGADVITDFSPSDNVWLAGYGSTAAATAISNATVSGGSSTIQLSDSTRITFLNVTNLSTTNIHSS